MSDEGVDDSEKQTNEQKSIQLRADVLSLRDAHTTPKGQASPNMLIGDRHDRYYTIFRMAP